MHVQNQTHARRMIIGQKNDARQFHQVPISWISMLILKNLEKTKIDRFWSSEKIFISIQKEKKSFGVVLTRSILFYEMFKDWD